MSSFMDYWDSSSDSGSEDEGDYSSLRFDEIVTRGESDADAGKWTYRCRSKRGAVGFGELGRKCVPHADFKLEHNPTDLMLLKKATIEVEHSLLKARSKLNMEKGDIIDPGAAFAAVTPRHFVELFHDYLKTSLREGEYPDWSLSDIGAFLTCETRMRFFNASEKELSDYGVPVDIIEPYKRVRKALTRADQPPSKRKVVEGGSQLPACSFDPIIKEAISACNKHWTSLFFVDSVSWCDLDDDKIPNCSPLWKQYGMKMTPTKDKKLKPVFHVVALIGAGYVTYVAPDLLNLKLGKMLETVINHLSPTAQASLRASLAFFIDRGYLELCQAQGVNMTNLVQVMEAMGVKYLGTIKNSKSFPFEIVDLNESETCWIVQI